MRFSVADRSMAMAPAPAMSPGPAPALARARARVAAAPFAFVIAVVSLLFVFTGSCSRPPAEDPAAARAAIEASNQAFMRAFEARDSKALAAMYAEDAKLLPPNEERVLGREAIQGFWESFLQLPVETLRLETVEVHGGDDAVTEEGNYVVTGAGGRTVEAGKYLVIWKKTEAGWSIARDMWSSNAPALAPASPDSAATAATSKS